MRTRLALLLLLIVVAIGVFAWSERDPCDDPVYPEQDHSPYLRPHPLGLVGSPDSVIGGGEVYEAESWP